MSRYLCQKLTKFVHLQSQTRSAQYQCTNQVSWKSIDVYSSYHPETKYRRADWWMDVRQTDRQADRHTDIQHETIIPCHYCVWGWGGWGCEGGWLYKKWIIFIGKISSRASTVTWSSYTGPSCSKLTISLVNDSLKFTSSDTQICWNFLLKKCE